MPYLALLVEYKECLSKVSARLPKNGIHTEIMVAWDKNKTQRAFNMIEHSFAGAGDNNTTAAGEASVVAVSLIICLNKTLSKSRPSAPVTLFCFVNWRIVWFEF